MNAFERFGIKALSPSSLNTYRNNPAYWAVKYLLKTRDTVGLKAVIGSAVEFGAETFIRKQDTTVAILEMFRTFDTKAEQNGFDLNDPDVNKARSTCVSMFSNATEVYLDEDPDNLLATQLRADAWFDNVPVPVMGYIDFAFHDRIDDTKTTMSLPSKPKPDHLRQMSLYTRAKQKPVRLVYLTPKKWAAYSCDQKDLDAAWVTMERDAMALHAILSRCEKPQDMLQMLPIDESSYYWSESSLAAAKYMGTHQFNTETVNAIAA